jgi:DNA-binding transcriptional ArsR family regulator
VRANPGLSRETAYERILNALRDHGSDVEETARGDAMAQCPSHADGRPSLHVTDGDDRALVYCFAECTADDVLAALSMTRDDLFNTESTDYVYRDRGGQPRRTVTRRPGKRIFQSGDTKGTALLYRLPEIEAAVEAGTPIYLVEGEPDVHAWVRRGYEATTAPAGAANFDKVDASPLTGAHVIAVVDKDEAGQKWAGLVEEIVGPICASLTFRQAVTGKDSSDHFAAGHSADDLEPYDLPDPLLDAVKSGTWLHAQEFDPLAWVVPDLIPEGFGLITGPPKVGKSYLTLGLAMSSAGGVMAFGRIPLGGRKPVLLLALEDGDRRMQARTRELLAGEEMPPWFDYVTEPPEGRVFPLIQRWLARHRGRNPIVILDTLGKVMPNAMPGEGAYQRDYRIGSALKRLAEPGTSILVVHHTNKSESGDWMNSTSGTNGLNGAADFTLNLSRKRGAAQGIVRVTGRDVMEGEYALLFRGSWYLDGLDLHEAALRAEELLAEEKGGKSSDERKREDILGALGRNPAGLATTPIAQMLGIDPRSVGFHLTRMEAAGKVRRNTDGSWQLAAVAAETERVDSTHSDGEDGTLICFKHGIRMHPTSGCPECAGLE